MLVLSRMLVAALLLLTACDEAPLSLGIGRAPADAASIAPRLAITLSRIYAPTSLPAGATPFVEMRLGQGADIDLAQTPLFLVTQTGMAALPQTLWTQGSVLQVKGAALAPLGLHANAGEIVVMDGQLNLHAYGVWGIAPSAWSQSFVSAAQGRQLYVAQAPSSLAYPLDANVAINLDPNISSACLSADPNVDSQNAQAQITCPAASPNVLLSRVQPAGLDTDGGWVELYNAGVAPVDLHGTTLCIDQSCAPIEAFHASAEASLPAGVVSAGANANTTLGSLDSARAVIAIGHTGPKGLGAGTTLSVAGLPPLSAQSEVALFVPGVDPNSASLAALSYLRLGGTPATPLPLVPHAPSGQSALWAAQGLAAPRLDGEAQARNITAPESLGPNAWALSRSAPGTAIADPASVWTSCSMPQKPAAPQDPLRMIELAQDTTWRVILRNTGNAALDVSSYSLALGDTRLALSAAPAPLAPGATLWVELGSAEGTPCSANQDVCWPAAQASLGAGALTLSSAAAPVGYLQWAASPAAAQPVALGLWPGSACDIADFSAAAAGSQPYRALRLLPEASGQSPADYFVGMPTRP